MATFDHTYTDSDFQQQIDRADKEWMAQFARPEPDLEVESLRPGVLSKFLALFGGR